jgi:hypothetical protein
MKNRKIKFLAYEVESRIFAFLEVIQDKERDHLPREF